MGAPDVQARIYRDLSVSLAAFYRATEGIGAAKRVTTYTDFDFGAQAASRTQIVLGASVLGGRMYPDTTASQTPYQQYAGTLGQGFGIEHPVLSISRKCWGRGTKGR